MDDTLRRLIESARGGDALALAELARVSSRRGEPWGAALLARDDLYDAGARGLRALAGACDALRSGQPDALAASFGAMCAVSAGVERVGELLASRPLARLDALCQIVGQVAEIVERWCMEPRQSLGDGALGTLAVGAIATAAVGLAGDLRAARRGSRKREARTLTALAMRAGHLVELGDVVHGRLRGAVRHLDAGAWWRQVVYAPRLVIADRWDRYWDYERMVARGLDPSSFAEVSAGVLRYSGAVEIFDEVGAVALRLEARVLRRGWLKALLRRHSAMGSYVRDLARANRWETILSELSIDDAVALDALRRTIALWRREEELGPVLGC